VLYRGAPKVTKAYEQTEEEQVKTFLFPITEQRVQGRSVDAFWALVLTVKCPV
jgi:hypothetical protein